MPSWVRNFLILYLKKIDLIFYKKAHSIIILSLGDKFFRKVAKEETTANIWLKLEHLYMTKSLFNRLHKKTRLYTFKMLPDTSIDEHLNEFNKVILDLVNIHINIDKEDRAIMLLSSLDASYCNL